LTYHTFRRWWTFFAVMLALTSALTFRTAQAEGPATASGSPQSDGAQVSETAPGVSNTPGGDIQQQLFDRLNAIRAERGLAPFAYNSALEAAAQRHTNDMQRNSLRSHRGSDGSNYYERMVAAGYTPSARWGAANETIGWGNNLDRMVNWWMNSPVHRSIILSSAYTEIGIGYAGNPAQRWGHWWTVDYGKQ
jgi:uncharacterized protein YkwD